MLEERLNLPGHVLTLSWIFVSPEYSKNSFLLILYNQIVSCMKYKLYLKVYLLEAVDLLGHVLGILLCFSGSPIASLRIFINMI